MWERGELVIRRNGAMPFERGPSCICWSKKAVPGLYHIPASQLQRDGRLQALASRPAATHFEASEKGSTHLRR